MKQLQSLDCDCELKSFEWLGTLDTRTGTCVAEALFSTRSLPGQESSRDDAVMICSAPAERVLRSGHDDQARMPPWSGFQVSPSTRANENF